MNRPMSRTTEIIIGTLMGCLLAFLLLTSAAVAVDTAAECRSWPADNSIWSGFGVLGGHTAAVVAAHGCHPSQQGTIIVLVIELVLAVVLVIAGIVAWSRIRESDWYFTEELKSRRGFAKRGEVSRRLSARAVRKQAPVLRPQLPKDQVRATDVAVSLGSSRGIEVFVSTEESMVLVGPPRGGKGFRVIINSIIDWPGPLITTSTRNDNVAATLAMRQKVGEVTVFDPQQLSGVASRLRISPLTGCADPMVAVQRARALVNGTGLGAGSQNREWGEAAGNIVSSLLMACALDGRDVQTFAEWGGSPVLAREAVKILGRSGPPGWDSTLDAILHGDEKMLSSQWFGVEAAVAPLRIPQIADAMTPRRGEGVFDPHEFLQGNNTLYLIGTKAGAGAAGGYLAALMDDIVEVARGRALSQDGRRLDPPLGLILDEIANIFSWPALPTIMADGGGIGICPLVVLQARSQAETAWSHAEMESVFSAATVKILLGGSSDTPFLRDMQELLGPRDVQRNSRSYSESGVSTQVQTQQLPLILPNEMNRLPQSLGLMKFRNARPVLLDLNAWIDRKDAEEIKAGKKRTEASQSEVFKQLYDAARARRAGEAAAKQAPAPAVDEEVQP